jgi:hypothetical protein
MHETSFQSSYIHAKWLNNCLINYNFKDMHAKMNFQFRNCLKHYANDKILFSPI